MEENTRARNDDYLTKYIILIIIYVFSDDCEHIFNKYCLVDDERGRRNIMTYESFEPEVKASKATTLRHNMNWELLKTGLCIIGIIFLYKVLAEGYHDPDIINPDYVQGIYITGCIVSFMTGIVFFKLIQCIKNYCLLRKELWRHVDVTPSK